MGCGACHLGGLLGSRPTHVSSQGASGEPPVTDCESPDGVNPLVWFLGSVTGGIDLSPDDGTTD